jgi:uncharacterized protein (DUF885 family)
MTQQEDRSLEPLVESYLDLRWNLDPVEATAAGVTGHDHRLGAHGTDEIRQYVAALKSITGALEECDVDSLDDEIDRTAVLDDARVAIHQFEKEQPHVRNPTFWVSHVLEGLHLLLLHSDRPREHTEFALTQRLNAVAGYLDAARGTLRDCPEVFAQTALDMVRCGTPLFGSLTAEFAPDDGEFAEACDGAAEALSSFGTFLADDLMESDGADFAIGEDGFNFRLHYEHALRSTAPELWRYGLRLVEEVEAELESIAAEIEPGVPWRDVADRLRAEHPSAEELVAAYASEMQRARRFVEEQGLVTIPEGPLEVVATPSFLRPLVPFAAYHPPGPFSVDRTGWFYVTPPDPGCDEATAERFLCDHNVYDMATVSLHEGYPGHHLHFLTAQAQPRLVRRVVGTPVTDEGWALYCEGMMVEAGFFTTAAERLFQHIALLWRACRVVIDVGLHTRGMTIEEAVEFLLERVPADRSHAEVEVRRYCATPTYQMSYAVGRRELLDLRRAYEAAHGSETSLRSFHDAVLRFGRLPVSLMRWGLGLDD